MTMPDRVRLPCAFDAAALAADVAALAPDAWTPHFNQAIYQGDWSGVALRSPGGHDATLYSDPTAGDFSETPLARRCPAIADALARLHCPLTTVRLLALGPGASIAEHSDFWLAFEDGEVRLHIPVVTNPAVEFVLDGRRVDMGPGECWYLNLNLPHQVANHSSVRRVHLVVDCKVNAWLRRLLDQASQENRA
jgi:mannose-6-phosphate isomerase-like protein (cupin superfamily)